MCKIYLGTMLIIIHSLNVQTNHERSPNLIYLLLWSSTSTLKKPFKYWLPKKESFKAMKCEHQNCCLIDDRNFFDDITQYDAILFNSIDFYITDKPHVRTDNQIYIYVSTEPAMYFPKNDEYNWFFNYTFTYKLDSDILYPFIYVKNSNGEIVAPKENIHWIDIKDMKPVNETVLKKLEAKKTAAAWFISNCFDNYINLEYFNTLRSILLVDYRLHIDTFGNCGDKSCPSDRMDQCLGKIQKDYYFYLAFENSNSEDYVTDELLTALNGYAVPVVLGGANYTRFLPNGTYLDANRLSEQELAAKMYDLISDKNKYYEYFKWHNHYTFHRVGESKDTEPLCALCAFMNDMTKRRERRTYYKFVEWWNDSKPASDSVVILGYSDPFVRRYVSFLHTNDEFIYRD